MTLNVRGLSEAGRILLRTVEVESHLVLSWDEVDDGQSLEQEDYSSEEDIPIFVEPRKGQNDNTPMFNMYKKYCVS